MKINLKDLKPEVKMQPLKLIVYGGSGIGKSTLAAGAPNPIFADIENGANELMVVRPPINSYADFYSLANQILEEEHDYKTFVVDTIDWFERHVKTHIIKSFNNNHNTTIKSIGEISGVGGGFGLGYTLLEQEIQKFTACLDQIRKERRMNIILLAHEAIDGKTITDLVHGQYTKADMKMEKKSIAHLSEWADMILYASRDISIKTEGARNKGAKGKAEYFERVLYTNDSGRFRAKNRLGLPEKIILSDAESSYKVLQQEIMNSYAKILKSSEIFVKKPEVQNEVSEDVKGELFVPKVSSFPEVLSFN